MARNTKTIFIFTFLFLLGILCASIINSYDSKLENPMPLNSLFLDFSTAKTPSNFIDREDILVYEDKIIINIKDASISKYASTGSMEPLLDENSNGIRIIPSSEQDISIGDIITFEKNQELIVHRVIEKGIDEKGTYFITKGDNNSISDGKIRFEDIQYITIGISW